MMSPGRLNVFFGISVTPAYLSCVETERSHMVIGLRTVFNSPDSLSALAHTRSLQVGGRCKY